MSSQKEKIAFQIYFIRDPSVSVSPSHLCSFQTPVIERNADTKVMTDVYCVFQVLMIQSCQPFDDIDPARGFDAKVTSPPLSESRYIEVRRENTVLMLAAGMGSRAKRGAFTGAVAAQLRKLTEDDEKMDLHVLYTKAVKMMKQKDPQCEEQKPEFRSTLLDTLKI